MKESIFQKIKNLIFGEPEQEIIKLSEGLSACSVCNEKIKGGKIYKVPGQEGHFCKAHAREAMDKSREENFNAVPETLKNKVHFSKEESFFFVCADCQNHLSVFAKNWTECEHCHDAVCTEHIESHSCQKKQETERATAEASVPRRCEFCGRKIVLDTSEKCSHCLKYFCKTHADQEHHECKN